LHAMPPLRRRSARIASLLVGLLLPASLAGASRVHADEPSAPAAPAPAPKGDGRLFDPQFREGRAGEVLVEGEVPLQRGILDAFLDALEGTQDVGLTLADETALRDEIENAWPRMAEREQRWFDRVSVDLDKLRPVAGKPADAAALRGFADAFGAALAERVDAKHGWSAVVARVRARKADTFSADPAPAVNGNALDAFEELAVFLVGVARNSELVPTEGQRLATRPQVRATMDATGAVVRRVYARMHRLVAFVKARWDAADEAGRLKVRWAVLQAFRRIAKLPVPQGAVRIDLPAYASMAAEVAAALPIADAYASVFANPGELLGAVVGSLGVDPKDLEPALAYERLFLR